jgi:RNA processing factor Prp31
MTEYQGTENLLALAKRLREVAPNVRDAISMKLGAKLMEDAADVIERLAHFEPDIDVEHGEN